MQKAVSTKSALVALCAGVAIFVGSTVVRADAETAVGAYESYGVSDQDVTDYRKAGASISACSSARTADPDPLHPTDYTQGLMRIASLYGECGSSLRKRHVGAGVLHTNGIFLGFTCSALSASAGGAVTVPACSETLPPAAS